VVRGYLLNLCSPGYCGIGYIMNELAILEMGIHVVLYLFRIMKVVYDEQDSSQATTFLFTAINVDSTPSIILQRQYPIHIYYTARAALLFHRFANSRIFL